MRVHNASVMHGRHVCVYITCARASASAYTGRERYVLTLCNGRIKDGPTPVKAPHTRRRLTTLFLRPTLARVAPRRAAVRSRCPSLLRGRGSSVSLSPAAAPCRCGARPPTTAVSPSPSIFISVRTSPLSSSPRRTRPATDSPTVHSLALLIGKHAPSLSFFLLVSPPSLSRHTFPSLFLSFSRATLSFPHVHRAIPRSRVHRVPLFRLSLFLRPIL